MAENTNVQKPPKYVGQFMYNYFTKPGLSGEFTVYDTLKQVIERNPELKRYYEAIVNLFPVDVESLSGNYLVNYWVYYYSPGLGKYVESWAGMIAPEFAQQVYKVLDFYRMILAEAVRNYVDKIGKQRTQLQAIEWIMKTVFSLKFVQEDLEYSIAVGHKEDEPALKIVDDYISELSKRINEYPDPEAVVDAVVNWRPTASIEKTVEVMVMAEADVTQTNQTNASSIFTSLLDAVYSIMGSIVDALKNYASEIAEILVATFLGGAVIRYGRRILTGFTNMISALF